MHCGHMRLQVFPAQLPCQLLKIPQLRLVPLLQLLQPLHAPLQGSESRAQPGRLVLGSDSRPWPCCGERKRQGGQEQSGCGPRSPRSLTPAPWSEAAAALGTRGA